MSFAQFLLGMVIFFAVVATLSCTYAEFDDMVNRKLKDPKPFEGCAKPGAYCDLSPSNWCFTGYECKRNPGIFDYSGTCVKDPHATCPSKGQQCGFVVVIPIPCCYPYVCSKPSGTLAGTCISWPQAASQEIPTITSA